MLTPFNFIRTAPDGETRVLFHFLEMDDSYVIYISDVKDVGDFEDLHVGMPPREVLMLDRKLSAASSTNGDHPMDTPPCTRSTSHLPTTADDVAPRGMITSKLLCEAELGASLAKLTVKEVEEGDEEEVVTKEGEESEMKTSASSDKSQNDGQSNSKSAGLCSAAPIPAFADSTKMSEIFPQPSSCLMGSLDGQGGTLASQLALHMKKVMHVSCNVNFPSIESEEYADMQLFLLSECRAFLKQREAELACGRTATVGGETTESAGSHSIVADEDAAGSRDVLGGA